jgi:small multidrug resistance pump
MSKIIIALYVLITSSALIALKYGAGKGLAVGILGGKIHLNVNAYTISGTLLYGLSFMLYVYLISKYDLGYIIPLATAFVYILIFFASFVIFKEAFTAYKIAGIFLIVCGLILLNIKG